VALLGFSFHTAKIRSFLLSSKFWSIFLKFFVLNYVKGLSPGIKADFNENIYKPIMKAAALMENEAHYVQKTVELQREIQKLKIR